MIGHGAPDVPEAGIERLALMFVLGMAATPAVARRCVKIMPLELKSCSWNRSIATPEVLKLPAIIIGTVLAAEPVGWRSDPAR